MKMPSVGLIALLTAGILEMPKPKLSPMPAVLTPPWKRNKQHWSKLNKARAKRARKAEKRLSEAAASNSDGNHGQA